VQYISYTGLHLYCWICAKTIWPNACNETACLPITDGASAWSEVQN